MLPVFCSRDLIVARNTGPSSVADTSSLGRGQETSTRTGSGLVTGRVARPPETGGDSPFLSSEDVAGGDTGSSMSKLLILDSTDWEDGPRVLGGTVRRKGGGEVGPAERGEPVF